MVYGSKSRLDNDSTLTWDTSGRLVQKNTYDEKQRLATRQERWTFITRTQDEGAGDDDRPRWLSYERDGVEFKNIYYRYVEDGGGVLVRRRQTEEGYNSDSSSRFRTTIYVYYGNGHAHEGNLWFFVEPEGVQRCLENKGYDKGIDPENPGNECGLDKTSGEGSVSDNDLLAYASAVYEVYDNADRVTKVKRSGDCGSCGGGGGEAGTYYLNYYEKEEEPEDEWNEWYSYRATRYPTGLRTVEFMNVHGGVIFDVRQKMNSASPPDVATYWIDHYKYDSCGRLIEHRHPAACKEYVEGTHVTITDLDFSENMLDGEWVTNITPNDEGESGLVEVFEYYGPEDGQGEKLKARKVQNGTGGTAYYVRKYTYTSTTYDGYTDWRLASETEYPDTGVTNPGPNDGLTTSYAYTYHKGGDDDTHAVETETITYPVVSSDNNGSNSATTLVRHYKLIPDTYDTGGELDEPGLYYNDWTKHEDGRYSYTKLGTGPFNYGQVVKTVVDADSGGNGEDFPTIDGWQLPQDGLDLTTTYAYYGDDEGYDLGSLTRLRHVDAPGGQKTVYAYECQRKTVGDPVDQETTTALVTLVTPHMDANGNYNYAPVRITVADLAGRTIVSAAGMPDTPTDGNTENTNLLNDWDATGTIDDDFTAWDDDGGPPAGIFTRTVSNYDQGQLTSVVRWTDADDDTEDTYTTSYTYNSTTGQRYMVETPDGTFTWTKYDQLGRAIETWLGTDDTNVTATNPGNLSKTNATFYDEWDENEDPEPGSGTSGVGDGNVTQTQAVYDFDDPNDVVYSTVHNYDWRNRLTDTRGPDDVVTKRTLDNLGRATRTDVYKDSNADFIKDESEDYFSVTTTDYDKMGRVYCSRTYAIVDGDTTTSGDLNNSKRLTTDHWYDPRGRLIKTQNPRGLFTKTKYDGAGRANATYLCYDETDTEGGSAYEGAKDVDGDTVIEQTERHYDAASNVWLTRQFQRKDNATETDELTTSNARVTYTAAWFDQLHRTTTTLYYGTNEGGDDLDEKTDDFNPETAGTQAYDHASMPLAPDTSDKYIVSKVVYDASTGRMTESYDNKNIKTVRTYDDLGRITKTIENDVASPSNPDEDRTTEFVFDSSGRLYKMVAKNPSPGSGDQETYYFYKSALSGAWVTDVVYPDAVATDIEAGDLKGGTSDHVHITYDRLGRQDTRTDQRTIKHDYTYVAQGNDGAGKLQKDSAGYTGGSWPTAVDDHVKGAKYEYDDDGRLQKVTSYADSACTGTVRNQVVLAYDGDDDGDTGWGGVKKSVQDHAGSVGGGEPAVEYTFEDSAASHEAKYVRIDKIAYPGASREVYYNYLKETDGSSGIDDMLSRVRNIADGDETPSQALSANEYARYTYLGAGTVVKVAHPAVTGGLNLTYGTGGTYGGFDQFGRVVDQKWQNDTPIAKDRYQYGYDRNSNRLWRYNYVACGARKKLDEVYHDNDYDDAYDGLDRLKWFRRGTITDSGGEKHITDGANLEQEQNFTLDAVGNWPEFKDDADGGGSWDLDQNRAHNKVNEIHGNEDDPIWPEGSSGGWEDPVYDAAGNQTFGPKPGAETTAAEAHHYVWDAWNRLVEVWEDADEDETLDDEPDDTHVLTCRYDGLGRRIQKVVEGDPDVTYDYYYSGYQVVEVRKDGSEHPYKQYVWGLRYVHSPVLRWRDENTDGQNVETLYYTNDANFNVTALVEPDGDVVERVVYDPYGQPTFYDGSWQNPSSTSAYANDVLFTGHRLDTESGLYYCLMRYYHPTLGRWMQRDPSGYVDGLVLYLYCNAKPSDTLDPFGLSPQQAVLLPTLSPILENKSDKQICDFFHQRLTQHPHYMDEELVMSECCLVGCTVTRDSKAKEHFVAWKPAGPWMPVGGPGESGFGWMNWKRQTFEVCQKAKKGEVELHYDCGPIWGGWLGRDDEYRECTFYFEAQEPTFKTGRQTTHTWYGGGQHHPGAPPFGSGYNPGRGGYDYQPTS